MKKNIAFFLVAETSGLRARTHKQIDICLSVAKPIKQTLQPRCIRC
jgi:hypothetical protein